jgi:hypothetical protein
MKRLTSLALFPLLASVAFAQTVTKVELARDNGRGKPGQVITSFSPSDNPLHCVVHIKPLTGTAVFTGTLIAVNAGGVQSYRVASTSLTGGSGVDLMDFKFNLQRAWPTGSYRVDVQVNGKPLREISFEVK